MKELLNRQTTAGSILDLLPSKIRNQTNTLRKRKKLHSFNKSPSTYRMSCQSNSDQPISFGIDFTSSFLARQQKDALALHQQLQKEIDIIQNRKQTSSESIIPTISSKHDFNHPQPTYQQHVEEPIFISFNQPSQSSHNHYQDTFPSEIDNSAIQFDPKTRTQQHMQHDFTSKPERSSNSKSSWSFPQELSSSNDKFPIKVHKNPMEVCCNNFQSQLCNDNNNSEIEKYMSKTYYQIASQPNKPPPEEHTQKVQEKRMYSQDVIFNSKQQQSPGDAQLTKPSNLLFPLKSNSRQEFQATQYQEYQPTRTQSNSFSGFTQQAKETKQNNHESIPEMYPYFKQKQQYSTCYSPYSTLDTTDRMNYNTTVDKDNSNNIKSIKASSFCESQQPAMTISLGKLNFNQFQQKPQQQAYFGFESSQEQQCPYAIDHDEGINQLEKEEDHIGTDSKSNGSNAYQLELRAISEQNQESSEQGQSYPSKELFKRSDAGKIANVQPIQERYSLLQNYYQEDQKCNSQQKEITSRSTQRLTGRISSCNKIEKSPLSGSAGQNKGERKIFTSSVNALVEQTEKNQVNANRIDQCAVVVVDGCGSDGNNDDSDFGSQKGNKSIHLNLEEAKKHEESKEIQKQNEELLRKQEELESLSKRYESEMKIKDIQLATLQQEKADLIEKNDQLTKQKRKSDDKILLLVEEQEKLLEVCERKDIEAEEQYKQLYLWKDRANNLQKEQFTKIADETKYTEQLREQQQVQCEFIKQLTQQLQILQNLTPPVPPSSSNQSSIRGNSLKHKANTDLNALQQQIQEKNSENAFLKTFVESSASNKIIQELQQKMKYLSLENERLNKLIIARCMHMRKNW